MRARFRRHISNSICGIRNSTTAMPAIIPWGEPVNNGIDDHVSMLCEEGRFREAVDASGTEKHIKETINIQHSTNQRGVRLDSDTYGRILQGCIDARSLAEGRRVHGHIISAGFEPDVYLGNRVMDMYAKCGSLGYAFQVFDKMSSRNLFSWNTILAGCVKCGDVKDARLLFDKMPERDEVSWNVMIAGYSREGNGKEALKLFWESHRAGVIPTKVTFTSVLSACSSLQALESGKQVHAHVIVTGFELNVFAASALLDMYAKCGRMEDARQLFDKMAERDVVSWTAVIGGYVQNGQGEEALKMYFQMREEHVKPNQFTFANVLTACANMAAFEHGKQIHVHIIRAGFESNIFVASAIIDMYAKCGCIEEAERMFGKVPERDLVSWTAMIAGYAQNGQGEDALQLFEQMLWEGIKPNHITFICVLSACSHSGLVDEGLRYFDCMRRDHCVTPSADHYACMIDLLGRAGRLDEAENLINNMPFEPDGGVWRALLGACRIYGNTELGKRAAECLFKLEPHNAATYVQLSNIYAAAGQWDDVAKLRKLIKDRGVKKNPGCSWIEIKNRVHVFVLEDKSHPQIVEICAMLERLSRQMEEAGYVPDKDFALHDLEGADSLLPQ